jgi:hypothetical protein
MSNVPAEPVLADHEWFFPRMIAYHCCRKCGVVKRLDGKNGPCRAAGRIALRDEYTEA